MIYNFLDKEEDLINLASLMETKPTSAHWNHWAYKYMLHDDLDPEANVTTVIRNLQKMPQERYPKTVNYRTIWDNMELVRGVMERPVSWQSLLDTSPADQRESTETSGQFRCSITVPENAYITFVFNDEAEGHAERLRGISINGLLLGHSEGRWHSVHVNFLRGLRVASIGNHYAAIQVKDSERWRHEWFGECPTHSSLVQIEWDTPNCKLVVSYNVSLHILMPYPGYQY
ncbi:hypothetical protein N7478_001400 [Penicillium angulare]|uniref:uncharacterized protein n=1 Tax=Penicillium angulare TaxID=116970 RepID=UPI002541FC15|nr:uncharacterized protein N7478_001400 [Penicillium angulare]KAJ5292149.1 hypothetical protein N7478_001400 [Penicillium angulare]